LLEARIGQLLGEAADSTNQYAYSHDCNQLIPRADRITFRQLAQAGLKWCVNAPFERWAEA